MRLFMGIASVFLAIAIVNAAVIPAGEGQYCLYRYAKAYNISQPWMIFPIALQLATVVVD